ncbi:hypothetical protein ONS95_011745 [Cadophora gregata]|uniref:uncharacterized protein n=1 Tax=Cadophora gregata TaxID=51156 RepID=UPI0026DD0E26|nr:uncharacterized protein ONS95_011745 [Cadophora gregata]KAK0120339.1 hypothetical protein ONS95_011745 [Cadophora gregata]
MEPKIDTLISPSRPKYILLSFTTSIHNFDAELIVRCNWKLFYIRTSPSNFRDSPVALAQYLEYVEALRADEYEVDDVLESDFFDWVSTPLEPILLQRAPIVERLHKRVTLQDWLFPESFVYDLHVVDNKVVPQYADSQDSGFMPPGVWLGTAFRDTLNTWTASVHPDEVIVPPELLEDAHVHSSQRVLLNGDQKPYFFKAFHPGAPHAAKCELLTYRKIAAAGLGPRIRVCQLYGVVQDQEGLLMGMLLTHIDHRTMSLQQAMLPLPSAAIRYRWASQLRESLAALHEAEITWGDAKADNILIDNEMNAWIIDFGGGYTKGWVDPELAGTKEGDLQGMAKVMDLLYGAESQRDFTMANRANGSVKDAAGLLEHVVET